MSEQWNVGTMGCPNISTLGNSGCTATSTSRFSDELLNLSPYRHFEPMRRQNMIRSLKKHISSFLENFDAPLIFIVGFRLGPLGPPFSEHTFLRPEKQV